MARQVSVDARKSGFDDVMRHRRIYYKPRALIWPEIVELYIPEAKLVEGNITV